MNVLMKRAGWTLCLLGLGASSCSKDATAPLAPTPLPPEVVSVFPLPRSTGIPYETTIWARFRTPLQISSVNPTTVFLKVDTRRIPVSFSLSDSNRLMTLRPQAELELRRTHTVEITTKVKTTEGGSLDQTYFWQFRTTSVRRVEQPQPIDGSQTAGPFVPLLWRPTDASAGPVDYDVYVSTDSIAVANGSAESSTGSAAYWVPSAQWDSATRFYWRVHARNRETGDEDTGPVWSFATLPGNTPKATFQLNVMDSGTWDGRANVRRWRCPDIVGGSTYSNAIRFNMDRFDPTWVLADAYLEIAPSTAVTDHNPSLWELAAPIVPCDGLGTEAPPVRGFLAGGVVQPSGFVRFHSVGFISRLQGRVSRQPYFLDYSIQATRTLTFQSLSPNIWVEYYLLPLPPSAR